MGGLISKFADDAKSSGFQKEGCLGLLQVKEPTEEHRQMEFNPGKCFGKSARDRKYTGNSKVCGMSMNRGIKGSTPES